eukprot:scaffold1958_cov253-Pinguiococcus_pyrenoidosus.AAC.11
MCGGKDPVTGEIDAKVLCRFSVVSGEGGKDVLIDTLVQPHMPVQDYRTDIHGITKHDRLQEQLEGVPFTLRHAQAAMRSICSSKTIIIGERHAVHNDLVSLRFAHDQIVDTALLYKLKGSERATPALRCPLVHAEQAMHLRTHGITSQGYQQHGDQAGHARTT